MMNEEQGKAYRDVFKVIREENEAYNKARKESPVIAELAKPECIYGYTDEQITHIMGARLYDFRKWMAGQTGSICDGTVWNPEIEQYEPSRCGPHGYTTYRVDVERYLLGLPVVD